MFNWSKGIVWGLITAVMLTAAAVILNSDRIQSKLTSLANNQLAASHSWTEVENGRTRSHVVRNGSFAGKMSTWL